MRLIRQNKYRNRRTTIGGITFDSRKEADRWQQLQLLERAGQISELRRQVRFELIPKNGAERAVCYIADFTYTENGASVVEDVKSPPTRKEKSYVLKRKMLKWRYPGIQFKEVD